MREDPKKFVVKKIQCVHLSDAWMDKPERLSKDASCALENTICDMFQRLVSGVNHYVVTINY